MYMSKVTARDIFRWRMLVNFFFGMSSGLPLFIIGSTLQAWMKKEGVDIKTLGMLSLVQLPYTYKFLWSPLMDRFVPPFLGRRRGWIAITQLLLAGGVAVLSFMHPGQNAFHVALFAIVIAFFSASQDIVVD